MMRRPENGDEEVRNTMVDMMEDRIVKWAKDKGLSDTDSDDKREKLRERLSEALDKNKAKLDPWSFAFWLQSERNFGIDYSVFQIMEEVINLESEIVKALTKEWVLKSGVRFQAKEGDRVWFSFKKGDKLIRGKGEVKAVDKSRAVGFVKCVTTSGPEVIWVPAEAIKTVKQAEPSMGEESPPDSVA